MHSGWLPYLTALLACSQIPLYSNRQTSSANRNAELLSGISTQGILLPVCEMSQCTGSKYPAEIQQITVCRSQRRGAIGDNIELGSCASRVRRSEVSVCSSSGSELNRLTVYFANSKLQQQLFSLILKKTPFILLGLLFAIGLHTKSMLLLSCNEITAKSYRLPKFPALNLSLIIRGSTHSDRIPPPHPPPSN